MKQSLHVLMTFLFFSVQSSMTLSQALTFFLFTPKQTSIRFLRLHSGSLARPTLAASHLSMHFWLIDFGSASSLPLEDEFSSLKFYKKICKNNSIKRDFLGKKWLLLQTTSYIYGICVWLTKNLTLIRWTAFKIIWVKNMTAYPKKISLVLN